MGVDILDDCFPKRGVLGGVKSACSVYTPCVVCARGAHVYSQKPLMIAIAWYGSTRHRLAIRAYGEETIVHLRSRQWAA
jgi:hypothetical protein